MRRMIVTNEHGAWVILFVPILSAIIISGEFNLIALLFLAAALSWFMAYKPAEMLINAYLRNGKAGLLKQQDAIYWLPRFSFIATVFSIFLIYLSGVWLLIPAGLVVVTIFLFMKLVMTSTGYSPLRNFTGTLLLTSGGFLADLSFHGTFTEKGITASVMNLLFFTISSSFADLKMRELREDEGRILHARLIMPFFIFLTLAVAGFLAFSGYILVLWLLPGFLPLLIHFAADRLGWVRGRSFKQLGLTLMLYSILFLVTLPYAIR